MLDAISNVLRDSNGRFLAYQRAVQALPSLQGVDLCIYMVGSFGRGEAIKGSDTDLFFVEGPTTHVTREMRIRLFSDLIQLNRENNYPAFSRDCEFLKLHCFDDVYTSIGTPEDDGRNLFTARLLLLLEGKVLHNDSIHRQLVDVILNRYFADYDRNKDNFIPRFLINDIMRYWYTLCLNYEAYRSRDNQPRTRYENLKLGFPRKLTCFSTVIGLLSLGRGVSTADVRALIQDVPIARVARVAEMHDKVSEAFLTFQETYLEYLALSTRCKEEGPRILVDPTVWSEAKASARLFSTSMLSMVRSLGGDDALDLLAF